MYSNCGFRVTFTIMKKSTLEYRVPATHFHDATCLREIFISAFNAQCAFTFRDKLLSNFWKLKHFFGQCLNDIGDRISGLNSPSIFKFETY